MNFKNVSYFFFLLFVNSILAQNVTGKIIDARTNAPIAFANILINKSENIISNSEGFFTLSENNSNPETMLTISFLGYVSQQITVKSILNNNIVKLVPGEFELDELKLTNKNLSAIEIMALVKSNFKNNFKYQTTAVKEQIFFREISGFKPTEIHVKIDKSANFSKDKLKAVNSKIASYAAAITVSPPKQYNDVLFNKYSYLTQVKNTTQYETKLDVIKATSLKNESSSVSLDEMEKDAMQIFKVLLDTNKYYRVKSGLFGSRDTISFRKNDGRKKVRVSSAVLSLNSNVSSLINQNNLQSKTTFDYVHFPDYYDYKYEGASYTDQNEFIYILSFKPNKSKAKYKGKLYINANDFAVVRVDYQLAEGKKVIGLNLKFLLGVKFSDNVRNGNLIFKKDIALDTYYLQYASQESGQFIYVSRPVKFIEITSGVKDVLAFDFKMEGNTSEKREYLVMNRTASDNTFVNRLVEKDFTYQKIKSYDPKIWKDYNAIEPLEEMKKFQAAD